MSAWPKAALRCDFPDPLEPGAYCPISRRRWADLLSVSPSPRSERRGPEATAFRGDGGREVFAVPQPDGTLTHVPCWMMQEAAAHHVLCPEPLLALANLRDLRIEIDALLVFLQSASNSEKGQEDAHRDPSAKRSVRGGGTADGSIANSEEPDAATAPGNADRGFYGDSGRGGGR